MSFFEDRFVLTNSADPDKMPPFLSFHLGLLMFSKVPVYKYPDHKSVRKSAVFSLNFEQLMC